MAKKPEELQQVLHYTFKNPALLRIALTHTSFANESKVATTHNERLEFLGDSVLSVVVADYLFHQSGRPEGELTRMRASLVSEDALFQFAQEIHLGEYLRLGHGEDLGGRPGRVSYMLQKDLLLPSRTILDNVCLPLIVAGAKKADARAKALPLFERFGLAGCENKWPSELSGGMRQRAAFLRTYLMGNDVALLDEPFSALDALTRADIRAWYCGMAAELGIASVVITHDVDEAVSMAHRIYVLEGDPRGGVPSVVAGEVPVDHGACAAGEGEAARFDLTDEFLRAKREVMALLG